MLRLQRRRWKQYNFGCEATEEDVISRGTDSVYAENVNEYGANSIHVYSDTGYICEITCSVYADIEDEGSKPEDFRAYGGKNFQSGMKERKRKKILRKEESLVFEICNERRLINERRNAVCERRPHDRHELWAKIRQGIVMKSLET